MADLAEKLLTPRARYENARADWDREITGTTAVHFGYRHASVEERAEVAEKRARAAIAMSIMQRAVGEM